MNRDFIRHGRVPITETVLVRRALFIVLIALFAALLPAGPAHAADHSVFAYGDAPFHGSTGVHKLDQPVVGMARTPTGDGYWLASREGRVFSFGAADPHGSLSVAPPSSVIGIATTASGDGYWLATADGSIYSFGAAPFYGSLGNLRLNRPIVGIAATPSGRGYWMVADDGGVFSFGDAAFFGSTGAIRLNQPITGMAAAPGGTGYWLVARDGGIFTFGTARFKGSTGAIRLARSIVGMASTPSGNGYWLTAADGGLFTFGDAPFLGSLGAGGLTEPAVGVVGSSTGRGYWIVTTGHLASSATANPAQVHIYPGTHQVGALGPVPPGTYRALRATPDCRWERRSADGAVLAARASDQREVVTILAGDAAFHSNGCAPFVNELFPITATTGGDFGDGSWIVNVDIAAGKWSAPGGPACAWERVSDFSLNDSAVNASDDGAIQPEVEIQASDAGFITSGCGTWSR